MNTIDKIALGLVIVTPISRAGPLAIDTFLDRGEDAYTMAYGFQVFGIMQITLALTLGLVIGWWLYKESKEQGRSPWVWFLLGLTHSLIAVVVFMIIPIYEDWKSKGTESKP